MSENLKCLHLGCEFFTIPGWINTDIRIMTKGVKYLDVTKKFKYEDETFDYIFSEHMIEHIGYLGLINMFSESFRTLKWGGVLRTSFPTLDFLSKICANPYEHEDYIRWSYDNFCKTKPKYDGINIDEDNLMVILPFVIDNFMKCWGHTFIPNYDLVVEVLSKVGFKSIKRCKYGESEHEKLKNLERHHTNIPLKHVLTESTCIEATKSGRYFE